MKKKRKRLTTRTMAERIYRRLELAGFPTDDDTTIAAIALELEAIGLAEEFTILSLVEQVKDQVLRGKLRDPDKIARALRLCYQKAVIDAFTEEGIPID